jgi:hypothetical protein
MATRSRRSSRLGNPKAIAPDEFEFPITLKSGQIIETVGEAFDYIEQLPEAKQRSEPWKRAIGYLHRAVTEDRAWLFFARMSIQRALDGQRAGRPPKITPRVKKSEAWRERRTALKKGRGNADWSHNPGGKPPRRPLAN